MMDDNTSPSREMPKTAPAVVPRRERRRNAMSKSLGTLLAIALAGLQLVAVIAVMTSSYLTSERALMDHARNLLSDVAMNTIEHSKGFLRPAEGAAELAARLAQNRIVASDDPAKLEQLLFQQLQITGRFSGVYYGGADGSFVYVMRDPNGPAPFRSKFITFENGQRKTELIWRDEEFRMVRRELTPEDSYDPRSRLWYRQAQDGDGTIWTEPYIFFSSQAPGITLASPVMAPDGTVKGVVGVDIEISQISDFLSRLSIGAHGVAMIINHNGDVIAHPHSDLIKARDDDGTLRFANINEIDDPLARVAFGGAGKGPALPVSHETPSQFSYHGANYVSTMVPMTGGNLNWTIAVYAPENDFTAEIKQNRAMNLQIALAVAAITGLIGLYLARAINKPVKDFASWSERVSQDNDLPTGSRSGTYRELADVDATLVEQITARRRSEHEYRQTFEHAMRAMAQTESATGRFLRVNAKMIDITGYSEAELGGLRFADLLVTDDPAPPDLSPEQLAPSQEVILRRKDGRQIFATVNAILIRDDSGVPDHAVVMIDDVTEIKAKEGQIAQLSKDLSHLARGNTMGQMASGLAHELNQPLTVIAQNVDSAMLTLDQLEAQDPELRQILTEIEQQAHRAGDIIRALRSFIRKDEEHRSLLSLPPLIEQTLRLIQAEAAEAGVTIRTELAPLPQVMGNRVQIAQVLVNLMRNAIEAISNAGLRDASVTIRAARTSPNEITVSVEDTGPGIASDVQLFTQFETSKPDGMGLGLSICRSIVSANGGSLWYDAGYRQGARFSFTLPTSAES